MNYQEVLDFLYTQLPMYQRIGKVAYKKDLTNTIQLSHRAGDPQDHFKSIHVAGTNGKGSTSHMIASVLQSAGYRVGLYTSPHLKSFQERIRVDGKEVSEAFVTEFVNNQKASIEAIQPSFFEITVVMAFAYFAKEKVDFAVIETGLGGRLDSTNIITPILSVITSISLDHQDMLGHTLGEIAREKAGIIKKKVPVVIGLLPEEAKSEIIARAASQGAPLIEATECTEWSVDIDSDLSLPVFQLNLATVEHAIRQLCIQGIVINKEHYRSGISRVVALTGLKGRWQMLRESPRVICDVGHNEEAVAWIMAQIRKVPYHSLHILWGAVNDKDVEKIFPLLIKEATYYFCAAKVPRALDARVLHDSAMSYGLSGEHYISVSEAYDRALERAGSEDLIFIGGSTFVVAELKDL